MSLGDLLFTGENGIEYCYDRPCIEIAWDQWSRTRIRCKHGVFEGISDFMDLEEGVERAMVGFRASVPSGIHNVCMADTPAPQEWIDEDRKEGRECYWDTHPSDCELVRGHEGEHHVFPEDDGEDAYWLARRVYFINGHDVTGKRDIP